MAPLSDYQAGPEPWSQLPNGLPCTEASSSAALGYSSVMQINTLRH